MTSTSCPGALEYANPRSTILGNWALTLIDRDPLSDGSSVSSVGPADSSSLGLIVVDHVVADLSIGLLHARVNQHEREAEEKQREVNLGARVQMLDLPRQRVIAVERQRGVDWEETGN